MQSYQISNVELLDYQLAAINTESIISLVFSLFNEKCPNVFGLMAPK